ncbi:MAG: hypothetical protein ACREUG_19110, partial [Steroidobacteraceae bacterium]
MIGGTEERGFERRARAVLEESLTRFDARTLSRLNRARQAALDAAAARRRSFLPPFRPSRFGLLPATGVIGAAVLAVAIALFMRGPFLSKGASTAQPSVEVLDMLADDDGIAFMENYDHSFYEWAAAQEEAGGDASGAPAVAPGPAGASGNTGGETGGGATG